MARITEVHKALMSKHYWSFEEADDCVNQMKQEVEDGRNPEDVLYDEGLEPDYFFDIIPNNVL